MRFMLEPVYRWYSECDKLSVNRSPMTTTTTTTTTTTMSDLFIELLLRRNDNDYDDDDEDNNDRADQTAFIKLIFFLKRNERGLDAGWFEDKKNWVLKREEGYLVYPKIVSLPARWFHTQQQRWLREHGTMADTSGNVSYVGESMAVNGTSELDQVHQEQHLSPTGIACGTWTGLKLGSVNTL
ncbi:hypothetical protein M0802_010903 [Mischocyttarus mexicanus]|nr:hypothetical protein M0802_010903 [Mischocyttarus mexicanus]